MYNGIIRKNDGRKDVFNNPTDFQQDERTTKRNVKPLDVFGFFDWRKIFGSRSNRTEEVIASRPKARDIFS
jgi:hypothetical protein